MKYMKYKYMKLFQCKMQYKRAAAHYFASEVFHFALEQEEKHLYEEMKQVQAHHQADCVFVFLYIIIIALYCKTC